MRWKQLLLLIDEMTKEPITDEALKQNTVVDFLCKTLDGFIPIYISRKQLFLFSLAVPINNLPDDLSELPEFSIGIDSSYSYWQTSGETLLDDLTIISPGDGNRPEFLAKGTPLTSVKDYRFNENRTYIQLPQDLTDIFQIHHDEETGDFCRIDRNGDKETVCHISIDASGIVVAIKVQILYAYLLLKQSVLVRTFDIDRYKTGDYFPTAVLPVTDASLPSLKIYAKFLGLIEMRGAQIAGTDRDYLWNQAKSELTNDDEGKEYCDFIIMDWKNKKTTTCSSAPDAMSSYFEPQNDKPFETSPAFFKSEVLDKYKNNPEVYELKDRRIYKIDGWELRTFDVNDEGQANTYLCYLGDLPYNEQLYWKSFNEPPRDSISQRAFETDFEGKWSEPTNPAEKLKHLLEQARIELAFLFPNLRSQDIEQLHRVITDNRKQWGDALIQLDQLVVESLNTKYIKQKANELGCLDKNLGSIKQLQALLEAINPNASSIETFAELHFLRNKVAHKKGNELGQITKDVRKKHQSYPNHFDDLLNRMGESIGFLLDIKRELEPSK